MIDGGGLVFPSFSRDLPRGLLPSISQAWKILLQTAEGRCQRVAFDAVVVGHRAEKGSGTDTAVLGHLAERGISCL